MNKERKEPKERNSEKNQYIYAINLELGIRTAHIVKDGYAICLITGQKFKYSGKKTPKGRVNESNLKVSEKAQDVVCGKSEVIQDVVVKEQKSHKPTKVDDADICDNCGEDLDQEDFKWVDEDRGEHFGTPCREPVCYGYKCSECGYVEEF